MMASPIAKYAFINAKLRARISNILEDDVFFQLAKAPSLDGALALLRDTPFARLETIYSETGDLKQAEFELLKDEISLYRDIHRYVHPNSKGVVDALLLHFEIENLKNAIRIWFNRKLRKRSDETGVHYIIREQIIHDLPIDMIINAESLEEIASLCEGTAYKQIIVQNRQAVELEGSLFRLEVSLDHYYYRNLLAALNELDLSDRETALRLIGVEIDLRNISWIIRFRNFYDMPMERVMEAIIPGGHNLSRPGMEELYRAQNVTAVLQGFIKEKYGGLSSLLSSGASDSTSRLLLILRILDEIRRQEVHRILGGYPFTVGIILAYFVLKSEEMRKLRTILNAKQYGRAQESIEGMI
jgi:V/A-type H+-transporting ATPase subunit C